MEQQTFIKLVKNIGEEKAKSKALGQYVWHCGVGPQMGYSFSIIHALAYSFIGFYQTGEIFIFIRFGANQKQAFLYVLQRFFGAVGIQAVYRGFNLGAHVKPVQGRRQHYYVRGFKHRFQIPKIVVNGTGERVSGNFATINQYPAGNISDADQVREFVFEVLDYKDEALTA